MFSNGTARLAVLVLLSLAMLGTAFAQDADPPGRVARLSYVQGAVSLQPAGEQDWIGAEINRPITTSDRLWSDNPGSRAELDIGGAVIRLGATTGFSFLNLDDNVAQMQVTAGTVSVHVRELLQNQTYEIDTPNIALLLDQPGQYRVDVDDNGNSTVVRVSEGQAQASGGGQTMPVYNQQMVSFTGTDQLEADGGSLGVPDGFDDWSFERDREYQQSASRQYVPGDMAGTEDLDDNGQWQNTPDYGPVWVPTAVAVGWAPYTAGHWAWISPWGWTWVDNASWGYAPFHYGRWAHYRDRWCWVPGPRQARPVYSPAMVAWVGGGPGAGAGVGWLPLGPREVFVPGYRVSDRYVRTINITNTNITDHTYITNVYERRVTNIRYVNSGVPGAVTSVPRNVFTSAQQVSAHRMNLPPGELGRILVSGRPPSISPVRESVLGGAGGGFGHRPPQVVLNRTVVARTAPPAAVASTARVRVVRQGTVGQGFQAGRGASAGAAGGERSFNQRMPVQQRPGGGAPGAPVTNWPAGVSGAPRGGAGPGAAVTPNGAPGDSRTWTDRAHALEQRSLPASQKPRPQLPPVREGGDATPGQSRSVPNGSAHDNQTPGPGRTFPDTRPAAVAQPQGMQRPQELIQHQQELQRQETERAQNLQRQEQQFQQQQQAPERQQQFQQQQQAQERQQQFQRQQQLQQQVQRQQEFQRQAPQVAAPPPAPVPHFTAPSPPPAPVPAHSNPTPPQQQRGGQGNNDARPAPRTPGGRGDPR